mmetsp:Transcript_13681/g.29631  ORF Transcript_13681/g.29631 Transcript_13681/m.29631 type:complete len:222 (+) Transcript_13681:77-742(+)
MDEVFRTCASCFSCLAFAISLSTVSSEQSSSARFWYSWLSLRSSSLALASEVSSCTSAFTPVMRLSLCSPFAESRLRSSFSALSTAFFCSVNWRWCCCMVASWASTFCASSLTAPAMPCSCGSVASWSAGSRSVTRERSCSEWPRRASTKCMCSASCFSAICASVVTFCWMSTFCSWLKAEICWCSETEAWAMCSFAAMRFRDRSIATESTSASRRMLVQC